MLFPLSAPPKFPGSAPAGAALRRLRRSSRTGLHSTQQFGKLVSVLIARESEKRQQGRHRGISATTHGIHPPLVYMDKFGRPVDRTNVDIGLMRHDVRPSPISPGL